MTAAVAVVTGAARGIGAAVVSRLCADGFRVVGLDVIEPATPDPLATHRRCDVRDSSEVDRCVARVEQEIGPVTVLVNNAAVLHARAVHETTDEVWADVLGVNLTGAFLTSRACLARMRRRGFGVIVNVASVHAVATVPRLAAYAASKGGLLALTRQMAVDYADDGIRVNAVTVGSIATDMSAQHRSEMGGQAPSARSTGALGRRGAPADVAAAVSFLASPDAQFVSGASLEVDAGMLARLA